MTLGEIAEAAVRYSDNTAGNILFHKIGGPKGYEKALRQMGIGLLCLIALKQS